MPTSVARPLLHTLHVLTFFLLFGTGLLIFMPNLRAAVTGGYSQVIRSSHRWGGLAYAVLPLLVVARFGPRAVWTPPERRTWRTRWQGLHTLATVGVGAAFVATGFVLWARDSVSEDLLDAAQTTHEWLTYAVAALLVGHLLEVAAAAVVARRD